MKLFKIILFFFAIYFIRRFIQFYRAVERRGRDIQAQEATPEDSPKTTPDGKVVEAEYKVVD